LTVGTTVNETVYLFALMERSHETPLLAKAARKKETPKVLINDDAAEYTF